MTPVICASGVINMKPSLEIHYIILQFSADSTLRLRNKEWPIDAVQENNRGLV